MASFYIIPSVIEIKLTVSVDSNLLSFLSMAEKLQLLATKLAASNSRLQAIVDAHPDPDTTD